MREFLYKNSFFRYASSINSCGGKGMPIIAPFISFYILMMFGIASGMMSGNVICAVVAFCACLLFLAGAITGTIRNSAPNLARLMPISGKRKCLYDFLTVLWYTFIGILCIGLFVGLIALIVWAVTAAGNAETGEDAGFFLSNKTGVYGGIFCAAYTVILYSAGMAGGYLKSRKHRNIFYALFITAIMLGQFFTGLLYSANAQITPDTPSFCTPFVNECYLYMKLPWLCSLLWCLIAAGMLAAAIYMGYKYHKPANY